MGAHEKGTDMTKHMSAERHALYVARREADREATRQKKRDQRRKNWERGGVYLAPANIGGAK